MKNRILEFIEKCNITGIEIPDFIQSMISQKRIGSFQNLDKKNVYLVIQHVPSSNEFEIANPQEFDELIIILENLSKSNNKNSNLLDVVLYQDILTNQREIAETMFNPFFENSKDALNNIDDVIFLWFNLELPEYSYKFLEWKYAIFPNYKLPNIEVGLFKSEKYSVEEIFVIKITNSNFALLLNQNEVLFFFHAIEHKYHHSIREIVKNTKAEIDDYFIKNPRKVVNIDSQKNDSQKINLTTDDLPY